MHKYLTLTLLILTTLTTTNNIQAKEADYVKRYCNGIIEYRLPDGSRCDCLTDYYAIEFDYAMNWYEAVGQSLHYAFLSNRAPGIVLIKRHPKEQKYINACKILLLNLKNNFGLIIQLQIIE